MANDVFERVEKKYVLNQSTYHELLKRLEGKIAPDKYFSYTICNIYFDTDDYHLVNTSLEKPIYKEKVRLRSYGIPSLEDKVYLEIKKKSFGVVGKRRVILPLKDVYRYLETGEMPVQTQIMKEIDYCFRLYHLKPKLYLAYDRYAYYVKDDPSFRITFDYNIRSRDHDLKLEFGDSGTYFLQDEKYIMEMKVNDSIPYWFAKILSDLKIYPSSFSKYGNIYEKNLMEEMVSC